jgi:hypothetical protein
LVFSRDGKVAMPAVRLKTAIPDPRTTTDGTYKITGKNVLIDFGNKTVQAKLRIENDCLTTVSGMFPPGMKFQKEKH